MDFMNTPPGRMFHATGGGAGLTSDRPCGHGAPAVALYLTNAEDGHTEEIGITLPSCVAPHIFGAVLAHIHAYNGAEAADQFVADMLAFCDQALPAVARRRDELKAQARGCCQADRRTHGREHTCGRTR